MDDKDFYAGTNIGATAEAGEQPSYGKTVWFKWVSPDPRNGATWRIMTCYNANPLNSDGTKPKQTDFDTILVVYQKTNPGNPWALNNLTEILRSDAAGGWEKGSEVFLPITSAGQEYYIRVDGKQFDKVTQKFVGAEGNYLLSWKALSDVRLLSCSECAPETGPGWKCLGVITPSIFGESFPTFGTQPKGSYLLKYCGGAWNYRDGWVVSRIPEFADKTWPGDTNLFGWFLTVRIGAQNPITFPEPTNPGVGWASFGAAELSAKCMRLAFELTTPQEVKLHFSDEEYDDNRAGSFVPHYGLYQLTPIFAGKPFIINRIGGVGTTRYNAQLIITNLTQGAFSNMKFTLAASGGVSAPSAPVTLSFTPGQSQLATFTYDMLPTGKVDGTLTLNVSNPIYDPVPDVSIPLLPIITTQLQLASRVFRNGPATKVCVNVGNAGNGPTYNLGATVTAKDSGGNSIVVMNDNAVPQSVFILGELVNGTVGNCNLLFALGTTGGATVTIAYGDTRFNFPPAALSIPSV